jgi:hypothetical protein
MEIKRFCMAFNCLAWLASMALITSVNSFKASLEDSLLSMLTDFPFGSDYFEELPLVKLGKFDLPEACIFLSILMAKFWAALISVGSLSST